MTPSSIATSWRKSSRSPHDNCVEVGRLPAGAAIRDTKNRGAGILTTTAGQWATFITAIKTGRYDH